MADGNPNPKRRLYVSGYIDIEGDFPEIGGEVEAEITVEVQAHEERRTQRTGGAVEWHETAKSTVMEDSQIVKVRPAPPPPPELPLEDAPDLPGDEN